MSTSLRYATPVVKYDGDHDSYYEEIFSHQMVNPVTLQTATNH